MPRRLFRHTVEERTYRRPRVTVFHVIRRTIMKLVDLQVWDVAASMTFFTLLSVLPALVSLVSIVSLLGLPDETVQTGAQLFTDVLPGVDTEVVTQTLLTLSNTSGSIVGVVLGLIGSVIAASNVLASFHRAMHRIHDTREGRQFLWFRTVIFFETLVLMIAVIALLVLVLGGGELSELLGQLMGVPATAVATWNVLKWPVVLVVLILLVSVAYHRGPNAVHPRFRSMSWGGVIVVPVLFTMLFLVGNFADRLGGFDRVLGTLNGLIVIAAIVWICFILLVAGAAFDAELLRARQLAIGLPAWDQLQLRTRHTGVLKFLAQDTAKARSTAHVVAVSARTGESATLPNNLWIAEGDTFFAVDPIDRKVSTGSPFQTHHREFEVWDVPRDDIDEHHSRNFGWRLRNWADDYLVQHGRRRPGENGNENEDR